MNDAAPIEVTGDHDRSTLAELLRRISHPLNTRCGQRGLCDGCRVEFVSSNGQSNAIQACNYHPAAGERLKVRIPIRSSLKYQPRIVTHFRLNVPAGNDPLYPGAKPGDLGAAIDIGTTTVVVLLVDLANGAIVSLAAGFNKQIHLGDDVVTRINLCSDVSMIDQLRSAIVDETIVPLLLAAVKQANVDIRQIKCIAAAGNTTMLHLLAGVDPSAMGVAPFNATFLDYQQVHCESLSNIGAPSHLHLLPGCSAYIGADLTAGIVASGLLYEEGPNLLVDIGTNGEIILKHSDAMYGCATAAGPAFEGAAMSCGMRAGDGAIAHIGLDSAPFAIRTQTIGEKVKPVGICGSAYLDFLAEGKAVGLLTRSGRFNVDAVQGANDHIIDGDGHGSAFCISHTSAADPVSISELDVSRLLQAKAAIAAGILTLLDRAGLAPAQIKTLYLAGGFGMHAHVPHAIRCGLLPGFAESQIQVIGNSALGGTYLAMLDRGALVDMAHIRERIDIVELNLDPKFEERFIDQLLLP